MIKISRYLSLETRFWLRVAKAEGCWLWTGKLDEDGYGHLRFNLKRTGAHVVSYRLNKGDVPKGLFVCHSCDNPQCVRPDHLFLGTTQENTDDRTRKGRAAFGARNGHTTHPEKTPRGASHHWQTKPETRLHGEKNGRAKLNEDDVREIRRLWATGEYTKVTIARMYGVTDVLIFKIVTRQVWAHIK